MTRSIEELPSCAIGQLRDNTIGHPEREHAAPHHIRGGTHHVARRYFAPTHDVGFYLLSQVGHHHHTQSRLIIRGMRAERYAGRERVSERAAS